ncbi:hypothetical protein [Aureibaculum luteum]|uniref:hypothetical protein n=1 Tax=Aureibaculum luteum TaxID=1548456 RepID=UPI000E4A24E8|nr:hypothetical protein [Aureibaculum luteum]
MGFFSKVDKVLAGLGNMKAMKRVHVDTFTEGLMESVEGEKLSASEHGEIWAHIQELGGYYSLNTTILSGVNIKTIKGGKLSFLGSKDTFVLDTDDNQLESDYSNVSNRWMTKANYNIDKKDIDYIRGKGYTELQFVFKKKTLVFDVIK